MHDIIIKFFELVATMTNFIFGPLNSLIEKIPTFDWVKDALIDSIHMLPFLFVIFFIVEFIEYYFSNKMNSLVKHSKKTGPIVGSLLASFPQCGFSVVASTLYCQKLITAGTLIAVYLATSDEAIPVILAEPGKAHIVINLLLVKVFIAIVAGYLINFILEHNKKPVIEELQAEKEVNEEGCCRHHLSPMPNKKELFLHPIIHTANVFSFILVITLGINYLVTIAGGEENLGKYFLSHSVFQPVLMAFLGLIPNCAASVAITLMYLKGAIGFGSVIAGLCSSAGLGMLVLLRKNNDIKDTLKIIGLLLLISIISGIVIQNLFE
jgi:hypothetical protein